MTAHDAAKAAVSMAVMTPIALLPVIHFTSTATTAVVVGSWLVFITAVIAVNYTGDESDTTDRNPTDADACVCPCVCGERDGGSP